jgi:polysaccharide export outer membrane protein
MFRKVYVYPIIFLIIFCSSCSNRQYQVLFEKKNAISTDSTENKLAVTLDQYHIQPQDILQIRNLQDIDIIATKSSTGEGGAGGNATAGQTFQVEEDGTVKLPAIGSIKVEGLRRIEAQKLIEDTYAKELLKNPIIELKIVNLKVTALGELKAQGNYPLTKDKTTIVELIGQAGGLTDRADERHVKIIRGTEQNPKVVEIDLNNIQSINSPNSVLQNGDIVYIAQNKRAVRNDNLQNFSIIVQPALILFNTALIILTLARK